MLFAKPRQHSDRRHGPDEGRIQKPLSLSKNKDEDYRSGYLHTYITTRDLRLLYIDGMSAGKTQNGTLDSQDRILFNFPQSNNSVIRDRDRAERFCQIAHEDWEDRIHGAIRMESGFEIILCSFHRDLEIQRISEVKPFDSDDDVSRDEDGNWWRFKLVKAVAARYHGIGGGRVRLDYEDFVSAFDPKYRLDLFVSSGDDDYNNNTSLLQPLPRLENVSSDQLDPVRRDLYSLVMTHDSDEFTLFNWQEVTDMVIQRYADELKYLVSDTFSNSQQLHAEVYRTLEPFIDSDDRNPTLEITRCANQFIPAKAALKESLAGRAVLSVTDTICSTLVNALQESTYESIVHDINKLINYLGWTVWKECRGCKYNEVCSVPMWPWGAAEDYRNPRCRGPHDISEQGERYWGRFPS